MDNLLQITNLHASYGAFDVLHGVDLSVKKGEITALLGSNGVGKTTLTLCISGILSPKKGEILFKDEKIKGLKPYEVVAKGLIQVPEGRKIFPNLSVEDNLLLGAMRRGNKQTIDKIYTQFPRLKERFKQLAGTLSGGEQQMLAIGRALMGEPELLILDEPSLGLSPKLVEEMFQLIASLNKMGLTLLIIEQNVTQTLEIAHSASVLAHGVIELSGKASDLKQNDHLKKTYLGL